MSYAIYWTDEAYNTLTANLNHLQNDWDKTAISNFLTRIDEVLDYIKLNPSLYPKYNKDENIHKAYINKRIILYYKIEVDTNSIKLLLFWNTWQDPDLLQF